MEFAAAEARARDEAARDLSLAWHIAAMASRAMSGKLPSLQEMMAKQSGGQRQSLKTQRAMLHLISEQSGIPLKTVVH